MDKAHVSIEIHGAVYDYPGKGHDRLCINDQYRLAAICDGAGGAELSDAIVRTLSAAIPAGALDEGADKAGLARTLAHLDSLPEGLQRASTIAIARVQYGVGGLSLEYANFGDSWLYLYDYAAGRLQRIAHTATSYVVSNGHHYISTYDFLGNSRSVDTICPLVRTLELPETAWSVVGCSDGVQDDDGRGMSPSGLEEILRSTPARDAPDRILDSVNKYDDASVFVIAHSGY